MFRDFWSPSPFINSFCTINNHILGNFWPLSPQGAYIICRRPLIYRNPKAETDSLHIFILGTIFYVTIVIHRISLVVQNLACLHCLIMEPYIVVLVRSIWICKIHRCFSSNYGWIISCFEPGSSAKEMVIYISIIIQLWNLLCTCNHTVYKPSISMEFSLPAIERTYIRYPFLINFVLNRTF